MHDRLTASHRSILASAVAALLVAGACSAGTGGASTPVSATPPASAAVAAASGSGGSGGTTYTVATTTVGSLGPFLTGEDGRTLYILTKDSTNTTTCTGGCATAWPPFTLDAGEHAVAGAGVSGTIGTFARPDGSTQVTYDGMPLYYFSGDSKAGDTNGQGLQGVWFVALAAGNGPAPSASSNYGY